ncbi:thiamine diphosphokinase [Parachlamydia sp. AcF125]|uniref:thiamine diphosphokinase n=1 Tax=Parachlamydia sp. AcF125 TaxID=2795736 RepID=UPI001BC983F6|nr:thiamine diphosphokinase [Parachlamydia sp. AcF125]MBS4167429.1 Thiamine pyrophosphokinase [Parachlamydia sp. AcF125]
MHNQAALITNGEIWDLKWSSLQIRRFPFLAAVDGGLNHCFSMQIKPDLLIGDLDSVLPHVLEFYSSVPCVKFPSLKDETDLALAVQILLKKGFNSIFIFGAGGNRMDHTLSNIHLMHRYSSQVKMVSEFETSFFLKKRETLHTFPGQRISLIPFNGPVLEVSSKGLKWELTRQTLDSSFLSQSNCCLGEKVELTFEQGSLLCCLQNQN